MDYVIAGLAVGAVLAIAGFILRELAMSHRLHAPAWIADAGLALMLAALITWALTFAALVSGQDDSTAATVVGAGAAVATAGALAAVLMAGRSRRPQRRDEVRSVKPTAAAVVENADLELAQDAPDVDSMQKADPAIALQNHEAVELADDPEPVVREARDWEEIWRETWGSSALPKAAPANVADFAGGSIMHNNELTRETWAGDDAERSHDPGGAGDELSVERDGEVHQPGAASAEFGDHPKESIDEDADHDPDGAEAYDSPFNERVSKNGQWPDDATSDIEASTGDEAKVAADRDS